MTLEVVVTDEVSTLQPEDDLEQVGKYRLVKYRLQKSVYSLYLGNFKIVRIRFWKGI